MRVSVVDGARTRFDLGGSTQLDLIATDPSHGQLAVWRSRTAAREAPYELVILDLRTGALRSVMTLPSRHPTTPVWSADASELAFATTSELTFTLRADAPPQRGQLMVVAAGGGAPTVLSSGSNVFPAVPLAIARDYVAARRLPATYLVVSRGGAPATTTEATTAYAAVQWDGGSAAMGIMQEFESGPRGLLKKGARQRRGAVEGPAGSGRTSFARRLIGGPLRRPRNRRSDA